MYGLRIFRQAISFFNLSITKRAIKILWFKTQDLSWGWGYQKEPSNFWLRVANNLAVNFDYQKERLNQHFKKIGHKWRPPVLTQLANKLALRNPLNRVLGCQESGLVGILRSRTWLGS